MKKGKIKLDDFKYFWTVHGFEAVSDKEFASLFRRIEKYLGNQVSYPDFLDFFLVKEKKRD